MPAPQTVIQAAFSRLTARLGSGLLDAAAQAAVLLQGAPERVRQEVSLFWQEVEQEAARLERGAPGPAQPWQPDGPPDMAPANPQDQIDALRAQVAAFSRRLDQAP